MQEPQKSRQELTEGVETIVKDALNSGLFRALRDHGHLPEDPVGGCVLDEKRLLVEELLRAGAGRLERRQ